MNPTLFIGLGGTGVKTLLHLKRKLLQHWGDDEKSNQYRFLFADTDRTLYAEVENAFPEEVARHREAFFQNDFLYLGGFVPAARVSRYLDARQTGTTMETEHQNLSYWLDENLARFFDDNVISEGAKANRQLGRFCLYQYRVDFVAKLKAQLKALNDTRAEGVDANVRIIVVSSCCGGTGSSMLYDVLFMCERLYRSVATGSPVITAVLYEPFPYIDIVEKKKLGEAFRDRYKSNAWAFFEEIEYAFWDRFYSGNAAAGGSGIKKNCFNPMDADVGDYDGHWKPFNSAIMVSSTLTNGTQVPEHLLQPSVANTLFNLLTVSGNDKIRTILVNDPDTRFHEPHPTHHTAAVYHSLGYRALEYPRQHFREYFEKRFAFEVLDRGLLRDMTLTADIVEKNAKDQCLRLVEKPLDDYRNQAIENITGIDSIRVKNELSVAAFCKPRKNPKDELEIDPDKLTEDRLKLAIQEVEKEWASTIRSKVASFAAESLGDARTETAQKSTIYERTREGMRSLLLQGAAEHGLSYLIGETGADRPRRGLFEIMDGILTGKYSKLKSEYDVAVRETMDLLSNTQTNRGLYQLMGKVLASKSRKDRDANVKAFNLRRHEYIGAVMNAEILKTQLLLLFNLAAGDEPSFQGAMSGVGLSDGASRPLLDQFEQQAIRIRALLTPERDRCKQEFQRELPRKFSLTGQTDIFTQYLPELGKLVDEQSNWRPGTDLEKSYLKVCRPNEKAHFSALMNDLLDKEKLGFPFETLGLDEGRSYQKEVTLLGQRVKDLLASRIQGSDAALFLDRPLKEVFGDLSENQKQALRQRFNEGLTTMAPEDPGESNISRVVCYCSADGAGFDQNGLAASLGCEDGEYVPDELRNSHRLVAVVVKTNYVKEQFKEFRVLEDTYNRRFREDRPHLSREWNVNGVNRGQQKVSLVNTLMKGFCFHIMLTFRDQTGQKSSLSGESDFIKCLFQPDDKFLSLRKCGPIIVEPANRDSLGAINTCPNFAEYDATKNGRIGIKTMEGTRPVLMRLANCGEGFNEALAAMKRYQFVQGNVRTFEELFLKCFHEHVAVERRRELVQTVREVLERKLDDMVRRLGVKGPSRVVPFTTTDLDIFMQLIREFEEYSPRLVEESNDDVEERGRIEAI